MDSLVSAWNGNLTFRVLATNFLENYSSNGINIADGHSGPEHQQRSAELALERVGDLQQRESAPRA